MDRPTTNSLQLSSDMLSQLADSVLDGGVLETLNSDEDGVIDVYDGDFGPEIQKLAFTIWAFEAGEDIGETVSIIRNRVGLHVSPKKIRGWRDEGNWGENAGRVHQSLRNRGPIVVQRMMSVGTVRAVRWMVQALDDDEVSANTKVKIASSLLDRGGFPALIRGEVFHGIDGYGDTDLSDMDDAELEEQWRNYRQDDSGVTDPQQREYDPAVINLMSKEVRTARPSTTSHSSPIIS